MLGENGNLKIVTFAKGSWHYHPYWLEYQWHKHMCHHLDYSNVFHFSFLLPLRFTIFNNFGYSFSGFLCS